MFKFKSARPYWEQFSEYQSFDTIDAMIEQLRIFESTYELTQAAKAVLNTLKLYSKHFVGVCWLKRDEIARKAGVSLSTVKRTIKSLKESGILTIHSFNHTKRGGQTHNIYVINPIFETAEEPPNEPPQKVISDDLNTRPASDSASEPVSHKNPHKNSNTISKDISIEIDNTSVPDETVLKHVPTEFIKILEPYYSNNPKVIRDRWKTVRSALKNNLGDLYFDSWDLIRDAWKDVVTFYKRGKIKKNTDDGLGAYFYGVLNDYLMDYAIRRVFAS